MTVGTRTCTKCSQEKPATLDFYYKHFSNGDGLTSWCKDCMKAKSRATKYVPKQDVVPNLGETKAITWLRSHGIPAQGGKNVDAVTWLDVFAWGCVRVEVKYSLTNAQNLWSWIMYSVNNKDVLPHVVLFIGEDIQQNRTRFFLFDTQHPELWNVKTGKRKVNVTYNYTSKNAQNHSIFLAHENKPDLIEHHRCLFSETLRKNG